MSDGPQKSPGVAIIDVGLGNFVSVANMCRHIGASPTVIRVPEEVGGLSHLILPGVGSYDKGMLGLRSGGWVDFLGEFARNGSILGICLGMQLLCEGSEEGVSSGLGLIPGRFSRFRSATVKIPHMGWNTISPVVDDPLLPTANNEARFYFAHSFRADCDAEFVVATTEYGGTFPSVIRNASVAGVQFHPEKSHRFGMDLLRRFLGG